MRDIFFQSCRGLNELSQPHLVSASGLGRWLKRAEANVPGVSGLLAPLLTLMLGVGIPLSFLTLPAWWYLLTLV